LKAAEDAKTTLANPAHLVYFLAPFWKISLGCAADFVSPHMNKKQFRAAHALGY